MGYRIINGKPYLVSGFNDVSDKRIEQKYIKNTISSTKETFTSVLKDTLKCNENFKISNHAKERLKCEGLALKDYESINKGFEVLGRKGCKNAVMIVKDMALIASVKNKTIITAVSKERAKENVFTNIDSVVIL